MIFTDRNTESIGFLIAEVRTANGAIPVENALVYVYPSSEGQNDRQNDVIYSLRTDSSGMTERVALPTQAKELSMAPNGSQPFTNYNVTVTAEGYYSSDKSRVPIFAGVTSILPFDIIPLSEYGDPESFTPDGIGRFTVTPNTEL